MELKAKIARIVFDARGSTEWTQAIGDKCGEAADAILSIPEIAEALGRSYKGIVIVEDASLKPGEMKFVQPPNA